MRIGQAQKSGLQRLRDHHRQSLLHRAARIIYHDKGVVIALAGAWDKPKAVAERLEGLGEYSLILITDQRVGKLAGLCQLLDCLLPT